MTDAVPEPHRIALIGAPVEDGASRRGCLMGPAALRVAGLAENLTELGFAVEDHGDLAPEPVALTAEPGLATLGENGAKAVAPVAGWVRAIARAALEAARSGATPIVMGGDHTVAAGSVAAAATRAAELGRPLHVLWLDAHPDFNTAATSPSGNIHGMALAAACDLPGLRPLLGDVGVVPAEPSRISMFGIRSVDPGERALLRKYGVHVHDMRALDEHGVAVLTRMALAAAEAENAILHVSFDVDFLEPDIAPGVGTTVPGGATFREAHLMMEMIHESGRVGSVDLVELNPFLDERGRSARLLTDLAASLFGRTVMDRPTQSSWSTPAATALQEQD